jgi:hypothetical protein
MFVLHYHKEALKTALLDELKEYHKSHIPIPPTNMVRDALKKMMEEREKSVDVEGEKEKKELKETKKKRKVS